MMAGYPAANSGSAASAPCPDRIAKASGVPSASATMSFTTLKHPIWSKPPKNGSDPSPP